MLIDTDYAGTLSVFYKEISKNQIEVRDITYVLAAHYHPDHIGIISELMELFSGKTCLGIPKSVHMDFLIG